MASFNATVDRYKALLMNKDAGRTDLADENLDVGGPTIAGKYQESDEALGKLTDNKFAGMQPDLRENILAYYKNLNLPLLLNRARRKKPS
jgi:hypothetical protein